MRAVCYARYSTDMQREESIAAQLRAARDYCQKKGYTIIREYSDEAKSGKSDNRPEYQRMLSDAKRNLFDIIVFHKIDRNARNEYDYYFHKANLKKLGVEIEYVTQNIDNSPEGAMMEAMLVGMAAYYSRNLAKEVMKGMQENALKAKFNGGYAPLGYSIVDGNYIINEHESKAIKLIFSMYLLGYGYSDISNELTKQGFKTRFGKPFGKNSLYSILSNPRYCGTYTFNKVITRQDGTRNSHSTNKDMIVVEDAIPAIISKEEYQKVIIKMKANKKRTASYKAKNVYLLSGLIFCGDCGAAMVGKATSAHGNKYQYYKCGAQERRTNLKCKNHSVNLIDLEDAVLREIEVNIFSEDKIKAIVDKISKIFQNRTTNIQTEKTALNKQKIVIERKMDNLYSRIEDGVADDYDMDRLAKVKQEMTAIRTKLLELDNREVFSLSYEQVFAVINSYRDVLKNKKDTEQVRALLNNFINKITISSEKITIQFKLNFCDMVGAGEPYKYISQFFTFDVEKSKSDFLQ